MERKLEWRPTGGVAAVVFRDGRRLMLMASANLIDALWMVVALESSEDAGALDQVFEEHAHANIAENVRLEKAIEVAEAYAAAWLANDADAMERCRCKEIAPRE